MSLRVGIAGLVVASLLLSGCGFITQKAVEGTTGVKVDQKNNAVTVKGSDGQQVTYSGQVPDELKDFPVPSGFKLDSGGSMSSGSDKMAVATWKGQGTPKAAYDFYKKTMVDKGWKEDMAFSTDDGASLVYSKGDTTVTIGISKTGDQVEIAVLQGKKK